MKTNLTKLLTICISVFCFTVQGQITIGSNGVQKSAFKDFIYHWDGNDITLYGHYPYFIRPDQNPRVPESGDSFTSPRTNDSFGYKMTAVIDWDTDSAISAIDNGMFIEYLSTLTPGDVNKHADFSGVKLGFGVDNLADSDELKDRVDQIGEALLLTFDTTGNLEADTTPRHREFVPEERSFINTGLNSNSALRVSNLHLEPGNVSSNNRYRRLDYLIYDASENAILSDAMSESGMELDFKTRDTNGTIEGTWTLDDGDIIILAYLPPLPEDEPDIVASRYTWGLWSLKMDIVDKSTLSSNSSNTNIETVLYPNPTTNDINIQLNKTYKNISIKLYSIEGRELLSRNYSSKNKLSIDIESLKSGHYFLMLNLDDNKNTFKIVKK